MKKITQSLLMFLVCFSAFAQFPAPYCGPIAFASNVEPITLVNFAGINNSSPNTLATTAHQDFTTISGSVNAGQSYPITLKGNTDGNFNTNLSVFIDWNQNGVFTDAGETYNIGNILNSTGLDAVVLNGTISVPGTALGGTTRMRVVKKFNNNTTVFPDSCNTGGTGFGQAEDYSLAVTAILPCLTGTNYPTGTFFPTTCDGFTVNEIATDSYAGDYFNVGVSTGQTYTFSSSVATDFYTISTDNGVTAVISGVQPLTWVSTVTGTIRVHINTNAACGTENSDRTTSLVCGVLCLNVAFTSPYPAATFTPATCDGTTTNVVATDSYAGEYSNISVLDINDYTFTSSVATDYITVTTANGLTPLAVGTGSVNFSPTADQVVRVYFHTNATCGTQNTNRIKSVICSLAPVAPDCASNPSPTDGNTTVPAFESVFLSWDAPTTGDPATSYNIYAGLTPTTLDFLGNVPTNDPVEVGVLGEYGLTVYWQAIPVNAAGEAVGCPIWSFTTEPQPFCLTGFNFPSTTVTTGACDGVTPTVVSNFSWAGDYFTVNVTAGETYTFTSSVATDFYSISTDNDATGAASGVQPLVWVSTVTGVIRVHINTNSACGTEDVDRTTAVICGVPCLNGNLFPIATYVPATCDGTTLNQITDNAYPGEYSNVQVQQGSTYTFSSSVATDFFTLSSDGIVAIANGVGPLTWQATYSGIVRVYLHTNASCGEETVGRFKYVTCTTLDVPGCVTNIFPPDGSVLLINTPYDFSWDAPTTGGAVEGYNIYAGDSAATLTLVDTVTTTTFPANFGPNDYGVTIYWAIVPFNAAGEAVCPGNVISFSIEPAPPAPANDDCTGAIALTAGNVFGDNDIVASNLGATDSGVPDAACGALGNDVWYSIVVPSTTLTVETQTTDGSVSDTVLAVYSGDCATLTEIDCSDDDGIGAYSIVNLSGLTVGSTIYFRLYSYNNNEVGTFALSAYDASLATNTFDNANFSAYPNPVKNILNLSYTQNIDKVQVSNLLGQEVAVKTIGANQGQVDMSNLAAGTYLVKVTSNNQVKTIKVIKE